MRIRKAKPEEASALSQIAFKANRHWGYPEDWIKQAQSDLNLSGDFITATDVYVAEEAEELRGFYALGRPPNDRLELLCVAPAHFGTGVGKELFLHAMEKLARNAI